jgi:hypothetical protein
MTPPGGSDTDPAEVAQTWAVMAQLEDAASSDELALLATLEGMRLMLVSDKEDYRRRGKEGLRGVLQIVIASLREHDPEMLDRLVEEWRLTAESFGVEW